MIEPIGENAKLIASINVVASQLLKTWRKFYKLIEAGTQGETPIIGTNLSLADFDARIVAVSSYASSVKPGKDVSYDLLSRSALANGLSSLESAKSQLDSIQVTIDSLINQGQAIARIEPSNGHLYTVSGSAYNIQSQLSNLMAQSDIFMQHISTLVPFMKMYSSYNLSKIVSDYTDAKNEIDRLIDESQDLEKDILNLYNKQLEESKKIQENLETSKLHIASMLEYSESGESYKDEIEKSKEKSEKLLAVIEDNQSEVERYTEGFAEFDKALANRTILFSEFGEFFENAKAKNAKIVETSEANLDRTDKLLSGATVAAIASAFTDAYQDYKNRAGKAAGAYYLSIFLLILCIVPLALYVYPGQLKGWLTLFSGNQVEISGVLARAIIALPAILLITFASKRYSQLFDMEREYSHRATLAKSVNAFKMEAPTNSELITTAVFVELQRNPLDRINGQEEETVKLKDNQMKELISTLTDTVSKIWPSK